MNSYIKLLILTALIVSQPPLLAKMTTSSPPTLNQIGQIAFQVDDLDRATEFYRTTLGLRHLFTVPDKFSFFDCDGVRLLIGLPEENEKRAKSIPVYFKVEDINDMFTHLSKRGVKFIGKPHIVAELEDHTLWLAQFRDSEGNSLLLMSEVAK